jgi:hypothetical protein
LAPAGTPQKYPKRRGSVNQEPTTGAYGLRIAGVESVRLQPGDPAWPVLSVQRETGSDPDAERPGTVALDKEGARIWIADGGRIDVDRATLAVRILTPARLSDDAVLHPYLALPAAFAAYWMGRRALHGGAFIAGSGAWALLADKGGGKSSTLGALLRRGHVVLSDDILVLDGLSLFPGPRSVDLRHEAAAVLGGEALGVVGARPRWRLEPGPAPVATPLRGFVHLTWGDALEIESLELEERLRELLWHFVLRPATDDALAVLDLAGLPAFRLTRPQRLDALDSGVDQVLDALACVDDQA